MKPNTFLYLAVALLFIATACETEKEKPKESDGGKHSVDVTTEKDSTKVERAVSPRKKAVGTIDGVEVLIDYGSPSVRGRSIWGGLEDYDKVWRAGADETTSISFSQDVNINGEKLQAGKYAFFIIPKKNADWIVIFNEAWSREEHNAWGAYNYDKEKDVLRINVTPERDDQVQETLEYYVYETQIGFAWENVRLNLNVSANKK